MATWRYPTIPAGVGWCRTENPGAGIDDAQFERGYPNARLPSVIETLEEPHDVSAFRD
jgi:hypothetical protein